MGIQQTKRIVCLSSGGPGNFRTVLDFCSQSAGRAKIVALLTDRVGIPSIELALRNNIPVRTFHFAPLTLTSNSSLKARSDDCDKMLAFLRDLEVSQTIDLVVSAFRRILVGDIVSHFRGKLINVHPADLSVHDLATRERRYVGIEGLQLSVLDGNTTTRTTIHYIDYGVDSGSIICLGPEISVDRWQENLDISDHERKQKEVSDRPALLAALSRVLFDGSETDSPLIL